jgi:hypothetical protein
LCRRKRMSRAGELQMFGDNGHSGGFVISLLEYSFRNPISTIA